MQKQVLKKFSFKKNIEIYKQYFSALDGAKGIMTPEKINEIQKDLLRVQYFHENWVILFILTIYKSPPY